MGMFDHFRVDASLHKVFSCCDRPLRDLQTKSFGSSLHVIQLTADCQLNINTPSWYGEDGERYHYHRVILDTMPKAVVYGICLNCNSWKEWHLRVKEGQVTEIHPQPVKAITADVELG